MDKLSIIIPTYKRKDHLVKLLQSLKNQLPAQAEVIVVEQGENHGQTYQACMKGVKAPFIYIHTDVVSTSRAKNIGAAKATGVYLVFYDDDVILTPRALEQIKKNFSDPTVGGVAGRVVDQGKEEEKDRINVGMIGLFGSFTDGYSSKVKQDVDTVVGCHAAWRRDIFESVGGFDEQFMGNAMREESDLSLRVKSKGYRIVFDPSATVIHTRAQSGGARKADDRIFWYYHFFSNETYFFLKHRPMVLLPIFLLTRISYILRCIFGFGREVSWRSMMTPWKGIKDGIEKFIK